LLNKKHIHSACRYISQLIIYIYVYTYADKVVETIHYFFIENVNFEL